MKKLILALGALLVFSACADKFQTARISIQSVRAAVGVAEVGVQAYAQGVKKNCDAKICLKLHPTKDAAYNVCLTKSHEANPEWVQCYAKAKKALNKAPDIVKAARAALNAADAANNLAEQIEKAKVTPGPQKVDWLPFAVEAVCFIGRLLATLPKKAKDQIQMLLSVANIVCKQ